jgi:putative cardiolipin synthase
LKTATSHHREALGLRPWRPRPCRASLLALAVLSAGIGLGGCATPRPAADRPVQEAFAPAQEGIWGQLGRTALADDRFHILNTGPEALAWRLRSIDTASSSVDLQTFLWLDDGSGRRMLARLVAAADRGVRVRILLDDSFTVREGNAIYAVSRHPNVEVRIYNPFSQRPDDLALRQLLNLGEFGRVDHRMHNKSMVVDNHVAIVGGRNLADEYFGEHSIGNFRDMDLLAVGPVVRDVSRTFDDYWNSPWSIDAKTIFDRRNATGDLPALRRWIAANVPDAPVESAEARLEAWRTLVAAAMPAHATVHADLPAGRDPSEGKPDQLSAEIVSWIERAERELVIVSAYLVPTPALEDVIERAEQRGVEVRILTNSLRSNNHTAAHAAYRNFIGRLVGHGADLHEVRALAKDRDRYMQQPVGEKELGLHAKLMLVDDRWSFVGSANFDPRSLELNTEMGLLLDSTEVNRALREQLAVDFDPRNAWHVQRMADGSLRWVADDTVLDSQPAASTFQRLEDWFLSHLPIAGEM